MSIGADPISQDAIAQPSATPKKNGGPPPKRVAVVTSDVVAQPEPR